MWLSLDLSSRTGWALWKGHKLQVFGLIEEIIPDFKHNVKSFKDLPHNYPYNLIGAIDRLMDQLEVLFASNSIHFVVVEHTEGSSFRFSQKYLEWLHLAFFRKFGFKYKVLYLLNKDWRTATGCYIKLWPEFQQRNKLYAKLKRKLKNKIVKHEGKRISRMDQKKLSVHIANIFISDFGFDPVSDDNIADAINLGRAAVKLNLIQEPCA
jgi:hypothetical protein